MSSEMYGNERRLALVIGVNEAPQSHLGPLNYALNDAESMAQTLQEHCGFTLLQPPLLGSEATSANVKKAVLALARERTDTDFLLLYFSGHGQPMTIGGDQHDIYLVTSDFSERDTEEDENLHCSMRWLQEKLYLPTQAGKVLLVLDCCYAGNMGRTAPDPYLEDLKMRINRYFDAPGTASGARAGGLRQALTATGHNQPAHEQEGHGVMTGPLLECLQGTVDDVIDLNDYGNISLPRLLDYLYRVMPEDQKPSVSGDSAGQKCILANYEQRATELRQRKHVIANEIPRSYIPLARSTSFQQRPGEFDEVASLLFASETESASPQNHVVGLIGMGGIGKTRLAVEIAYEYKELFPAGVFWMAATGTNLAEWQHQFAELAANTEYLPPGDDVSHPENEVRRARHLARYLAHHPDALLLLDNVEQIAHLLDALTTLAGEEVHCTILYTSRTDVASAHIQQYRVSKLPDDMALRLLLKRRSALLEQILANGHNQEAKAAHNICHYVECLPLALTLLRDILQDTHLTLVYLDEQLRLRGALDITKEQDVTDARLFSTFLLSWQNVRNPDAQRLFKLASFFPEAAPIPLWLLALAAKLEGNTSIEPLGKARLELSRWSLIEELPNDAIRLHPIIREVARYLVAHDKERDALLTAAQAHLTNEFTDVYKLEQRVLEEGYWRCLGRMQEVAIYAQQLGIKQAYLLERVAYWLARDSSLLGTGTLWPEVLPGLFYQQLHNRALEDGCQLSGTEPDTRWVQQLSRVGAEDQSLLREFRHPAGVTCVAFSPDGNLVATGCEDFNTRIWDIGSGQMMQVLQGHNSPITGVAFSPDSNKVVACSYDEDALLWNALSGQLLQTFRGHKYGLYEVSFSPEGRYVAARLDHKIIRVWDSASGELVAQLIEELNWMGRFAFSPDSKQVATISSFGVNIWDRESEKIVGALGFGRIVEWGEIEHLSIVFSPDAKYILCSSLSGVYIWDGSQQMEGQTLLPQEYLLYITMSYRVSNTTLSADSKYIALASDTIVGVFQVHNSMRLALSCGHNAAVTSMDFSPDNTKMLTGSSDGTARAWKIAPLSLEKIAVLPYIDTIEHMVFSSTGTRLIILANKGLVQTWNISDGEVVRTMQIAEDQQADCVHLSPDGKSVIVGIGNEIQITDIEQMHHVTYTIPSQFFATNSLISCIASSSNGMYIAFATNQEEVQVWCLNPWKRIVLLSGHHGSIKQIAFSPNGDKIVTGATDGKADIWELTNDLYPINVFGQYAGRCIGISPDGRMAAVGLFSNAVDILSMEKCERLMIAEGHTQPVTILSFSPAGRFLLSADQSGLVLFWRVEVDGQMTKVPMGIYLAANEIAAVYWHDEQHVILADLGGMQNRPHFYHLALEGMW